MDENKRMFANYINAARDLAESIKRDIQRDGKITNSTVLALNAFIISTNATQDITNEITNDTQVLN